MGKSHNNRMHFKVDFENTPLLNIKKNIDDEKDFDDIVGSLRLKLFGK